MSGNEQDSTGSQATMQPSDDGSIRRQPVFPPKGVAPDTQNHPHPNAEAMMNAAVKHIAPNTHASGSPKGDIGVEAQSVSEDRGHKEEDHVEEPLLGGTPLDEMKTPSVEKGFFRMTPATNQQDDKGDRAGSLTPEARASRISDEKADTLQPLPQSQARGGAGGGKRPDINAIKGMGGGSVRMGTSALISALNALPWEGGDDTSSSDEDDAEPSVARAPAPRGTTARPKVSRLHSSLQTIRPHEEDDLVHVPRDTYLTPSNMSKSQQQISFPFRDNTIARRAKSPGQSELDYQFSELSTRNPAESAISPARGYFDGQSPEVRRLSKDSTASSDSGPPISSEAQAIVQERIAKEESMAEGEEKAEVTRAVEEGLSPPVPSLAPPMGDASRQGNVQFADFNTAAALREGSGDEEIVEDRMQGNTSEKKRLRKELLAEKLMEVFGLNEREEVLEEMRCWLLRSVMLKGYMYLTAKHICFFAHMPNKENLVVKTGPLYKKASRTKMNTKFWFVLRNDVLSWYESTADPYFPKGNIALEYASSCDAVDDNRFKLRTPERNYTFKADTEDGRDEWIKAIQKVMFKMQHEGEAVKLVIPLEAVVEVDRAPTLEFSETLEVKCVDGEDQMSVDSYFFASFHDVDRAQSAIEDLLATRPSIDLPQMPSTSSLPVDETSTQKQKPRTASLASAASVATTTSTNAATAGLKKLSSVLKPITSITSRSSDHEGGSGSGFKVPFISKKETQEEDSVEYPTAGNGEDIETDDGYPPRQSGRPPAGMAASGEDGKTWAPGWIRKPATKIFGTSPSSSSSNVNNNILKPTTSNPLSPKTSRASAYSGPPLRETVTEVVEPLVPSASSSGEPGSAQYSLHSPSETADGRDQSSYSLMEQSEGGQAEDDETARKFRSVFSLSDKEELIEHFPGYLYRVLPVSGRFFVSTNYLCFRSSQLLYKTKMMIPIRDLYGLKAQKAFRPGHSGLIVVIKGHEELFLEFSSAERRKACVVLLEELMEQSRLRSEGDSHQQSQTSSSELSLNSTHSERVQARIMEDLDESTPLDPAKRDSIQLGPAGGSGEGGQEGIIPTNPLFESTTSTFLEFKPEKMRITCLTIGSRGDVQPYIALCKGLQAEGHITRIASHGEYKDWVEGHGIEFASVGGDPAELMQMCVDNGMFTVSFLKEGIQKFRGWLDDLLNSSWEACQGSDLLIESPSAMGGIHIAEALRIPYYRAFTMPWTRTRAYPHAFAVPEHKRGGSYNYMTYTMFDQVFWRAIAGQVNSFRKKVMGIESTTFDKLEQHKVPFLYNFSPSVVPPPLDWTEWIHVTGYWFLENADESAKAKKWTPPEGLLEFIDYAHDQGKKVVYIGFGSIVVSDPEEMTRCVVEAVQDSGVFAILSKGWSDRGSKSKGEVGDKDGADGVIYPKEIFSIDSIDHSWLFPRIDAACHHGGAGTSGASLRAGIPTIIKPFFGDQAFWSERVESLNVGSAVRKLTVDSLSEALKKATTDEKQIAKAKVVGEMIRRENGVAKAIEAIYRDLEYAKSLIKPLPGSAPNTSPDEDEDEADEVKEMQEQQPHKSSSGIPLGLGKVTSILSGKSLSLSRSRSRSRSRSQSEGERGGGGSDESWSVLSESGRE